MSGRRIAVLHDSPEFGGHERAFLTWLPALIASPEVEALEVWVPEANVRLHAALKAMGDRKLNVTPSPYVKGPAEPLRAPLRSRFGRAAAAFAADRRADTVLLLQGRIENLATPLLWLPRRLDVVSYLPMAHSGVEMGRSGISAAFTDALKRLYYQRPARFIVPSHAVAAQVRRAGGRAPICVVENVAPTVQGIASPEQARADLGLPDDGRLALFMGRFDAYQKGLDRLVRALEQGASRLKGWRFVFVGQGPAASSLHRLLQDRLIDGEVVEWTDRPQAYLAACDVLLLPSRFEGVPLVMLEALKQGTPILASGIDVFREYLPPVALQDFSGEVDLRAALDRLASPAERQAYRVHAGSLSRRLDVEVSRARFASAVLGRDAGATESDRASPLFQGATA